MKQQLVLIIMVLTSIANGYIPTKEKKLKENKTDHDKEYVERAVQWLFVVLYKIPAIHSVSYIEYSILLIITHLQLLYFQFQSLVFL